jgi:hypothetical protein
MNRIAIPLGAALAVVVAAALLVPRLTNNVGTPTPLPTPLPTPTSMVSPIADDIYAAAPMNVADILARLGAETTLTADEKTAIQEDVLGGLDGTTFLVELEIDGPVFRFWYGRDDEVLFGEPAWSMSVLDADTIEVDRGEGTTTFDVTTEGESFSLRATTDAPSPVEAFVRSVLFETSPFSPRVAACSLVTSEEAAQLAGDVGLGALPSETGNGSSTRCSYRDGGGNPVLYVDLTRFGGAAAFEAVGAEAGMEPVAELGDGALYRASDGELHVLQDDSLIAVQAIGRSLDTRLVVGTDVAEIALGRL